MAGFLQGALTDGVFFGRQQAPFRWGRQQLRHPFPQPRNGPAGDLVNMLSGQCDGPRDLVKAGSLALAARRAAHHLLDPVANVIGACLLVAPLQVGEYPFVGATAFPDAIGAFVAEGDAFLTAPVEDDASLGCGQVTPGFIQGDAVVFGDAAHTFEGVAFLIFRHAKDDGALVQGTVRIRHDELGVELQLVAQSLAGGAGSVRAVEREGARLDLRQADAADRTGELLGEEHIPLRDGCRIGRAHHSYDEHAISQPQRGFHRIGDPADEVAVRFLRLLGGIRDDKAIHHRLDVVQLVAVEFRHFLQLVGRAIHADADEA